MQSALIGLVAFASACSYHPNSFRDRQTAWPGVGTTVGCIDIAVASSAEPDLAEPVVAYGIGNRCDHRVVVDLASVRVIARDRDGREVLLAPYDPRGELRPQVMSALWSGHARIAYAADDALVASICVDVGRVDRGATPTERWICVAKERP